MSFESLGLSKPVLRGIAKAGYDAPTDIQIQAIPPALEGRHLIALGQTGSGKTAAFGLPILERILAMTGDDAAPGLRAVILVPTRELCVQVAENLRIYAEFTGLHVRTAFGGIDIGIQEAAFRRGLDVLVACPGRLIDHLSCGNVTLERVQDFVLDEADRMLDMGFMPQIRRIVAHLPQVRRNGLFSATMPPEIEKLVQEHFEGAVRIQVGSRSQAATTIIHEFQSVSPQQKERDLVQMLEARDDTVILFVKTKKRAEEVGRKLKAAGLPADSLHGDKGAEQRHVVLKGFASRRLRFLVATDVAARGLDISNVGLVVNFDMPHALEDYIHRVGRTGRAGKEGHAVTYVGRADQGLCEQIVKHLAKSSDGLARVMVDGVERVAPAPKKLAPKKVADTEPAAEPRTGSRSDRPARRERPERSERPARRERAERSERPERRERAERGPRTETGQGREAEEAPAKRRSRSRSRADGESREPAARGSEPAGHRDAPRSEPSESNGRSTPRTKSRRERSTGRAAVEAVTLAESVAHESHDEGGFGAGVQNAKAGGASAGDERSRGTEPRARRPRRSRGD